MLTQTVLTNFKVFRNQSIALAPLTLLTGLNGSGKSTVMQALAMLRQSHDSGFLPNWLLNGELVELGSGSDVLHDNPMDGGLMSIVVVNPGSADLSWTVEYDSKADVLTAERQTEPRPDLRANLFQTGFQYLRADRVSPAVTSPKSQYAVVNRKFLGSRGEFAAHFLLEYGGESVCCPSLVSTLSGYSEKLLSQTNAWMQVFSPGVRLEVENIRGTDFVQLRYSYKTKGIGGGSGQFRATNVGFGLSYSLPIVVACLAAKPGTLLLIENPEAHLHPAGQLAMGELMARASTAGVQVIVETHSDHVLNGIRLAVKRGLLRATDAAFHFFNRAESGAAELRSPTISPDGMLSDWPNGFFTQWDDTLVQLLS